VRYAFVAEHRPLFSVRVMCRCLRIHPSGFYAWLKTPLSKRAKEDVRQTELIRTAWNDSGKVYGYRKLHDDLLDQGETCCPNRVARLAQLAGIKAQIGYKRRPGSYGGKPSVVVDNTLDRQFDVGSPDRVWVTDITYIRTLEGFAYLAVVIDLYSRRVVGLLSALQNNACRAVARCRAVRRRTSCCRPCSWRSGEGNRRARC
jgi:putative transposase